MTRHRSGAPMRYSLLKTPCCCCTFSPPVCAGSTKICSTTRTARRRPAPTSDGDDSGTGRATVPTARGTRSPERCNCLLPTKSHAVCVCFQTTKGAKSQGPGQRTVRGREPGGARQPVGLPAGRRGVLRVAHSAAMAAHSLPGVPAHREQRRPTDSDPFSGQRLINHPHELACCPSAEPTAGSQGWRLHRPTVCALHSLNGPLSRSPPPGARSRTPWRSLSPSIEAAVSRSLSQQAQSVGA